MVGYLNHDDLLVRDLAFWQLDRLGTGGRLPEDAKRIRYDPNGEPEARRRAVEKWKQVLAEGKIPASPHRCGRAPSAHRAHHDGPGFQAA